MSGAAVPGGAVSGGAVPGGAVPGGAVPGAAVPGGAAGRGVVPRGAVLRGRVWPGGDEEAYDDGVVVVDGAGRIEAVGPAAAVDVPGDRPVVAGGWVGPAVADAHVHLAFGSAAAMLAGGVGWCRDLGAPLPDALRWRGDGRPVGRTDGAYVEVAGPLLTAPGGYPSRSWGAGGFGRFVTDADEATAAVAELAAHGIRVVKLAFEPRDGPVLDQGAARAAVGAAHAAGAVVVAHALTVPMVERALDAGVDELAHVPVEPLPADVVARVAATAVVTATLWTFTAAGHGDAALGNAAALLAAGGRLRYGTDLGNDGTRSGVEPRELEALARAGLGRAGALRLATTGWWDGAPLRLVPGAHTPVVVLAGDPLADPGAWRRVSAVTAAGALVPGAADD